MKANSDPKRSTWIFIGAVVLLAGGLFFFAKGRSKSPDSGGAPAYRVHGPASAKAEIIEFSDFQCPSCKYAQPPLERLKDFYKGKVRITFRHYPLQGHQWAKAAAAAAECAGFQDKFWPMHDLLFERQAQWSKAANAPREFEGFAEELELDLSRFRSCVGDPETVALIQKDVDLGNKVKVAATPTFFSGDIRIVGGRQLTELGGRSIEAQLR